jgi:hypothetical protein
MDATAARAGALPSLVAWMWGGEVGDAVRVRLCPSALLGPYTIVFADDALGAD